VPPLEFIPTSREATKQRRRSAENKTTGEASLFIHEEVFNFEM
jgi:hypothetical protein